MTFSSIVEQQDIRDHLQTALRLGRLNHAYLITGEAGMGRKLVARTFAQAALCTDLQITETGAEPCGKCRSCIMMEAGTHPEYRELTHEKKAYGIDEIRTQLVEDIALRPMVGERRVYFIAEGDLLSTACQNAVLKTLEEPPEYVLILIACESPEALLETIRSRMVQLPLKPVSDAGVKQYLMRQERIPDYLAAECAAMAFGNIGKAVRYAADDSFRNMVDRTTALLLDLKHLDTHAAMERVYGIFFPPEPGEEGAKKKKKQKKLKDAGAAELMRFLDLLMLLNRDAMVCKALGSPEKLVFAGQEAYDREAAGQEWSVLQGNLNRIGRARQRLSASLSADLVLELLLLGMKHGEDL